MKTLNENQLVQNQQRQLILDHHHISLYVGHVVVNATSAKDGIIVRVAMVGGLLRRDAHYLEHEAAIEDHQPQERFLILPSLVEALISLLQSLKLSLHGGHELVERLLCFLEEVEQCSVLVLLHRHEVLLAMVVRAEGDDLGRVDLSVQFFYASGNPVYGLLGPLFVIDWWIDVLGLTIDLHHPAFLSDGRIVDLHHPCHGIQE